MSGRDEIRSALYELTAVSTYSQLHKVDEALRIVGSLIHLKGLDSVTIVVRSDGRVDMMAENGVFSAWTEHTDLAPGGPLPLPSKALQDRVKL